MANSESTSLDDLNSKQTQTQREQAARELAEKVNKIQKTLDHVQRRLVTQQHLVSREFEFRIRNIYDSVINDINGVRNEVNTIGDTVAQSGKYKTWTPTAPFRKGVLKSTTEQKRKATNLKSSKSVDFVDFKKNERECLRQYEEKTSSFGRKLSRSTSCIDSKYSSRSRLPGYGCCFYGDRHTVPYRTYRARPSFYRDPRHSWGPSRCGSRSTLDDDDFDLDKSCMCGKVTEDWRVNVAPFMWDGWAIPGLDVDDVEKLRERFEKFEKFKTEAVEAHNEYRRRHGCPELTSSEKLSRDAQKWAELIAMKGYAQYSELSSRGENVMVLDIEDDLSGRQVVDTWYREHTLYNYRQPRWQRGTSNFTQMIWKSSQHIGVGIAKYPYHDTYIIVAQYEPAGNINTPAEYRENVPPVEETKSSDTKLVEEITSNGPNLLEETTSNGPNLVEETTRNGPNIIEETTSNGPNLVEETTRNGPNIIEETTSNDTTLVDETTVTETVSGVKKESGELSIKEETMSNVTTLTEEETTDSETTVDDTVTDSEVDQPNHLNIEIQQNDENAPYEITSEVRKGHQPINVTMYSKAVKKDETRDIKSTTSTNSRNGIPYIPDDMSDILGDSCDIYNSPSDNYTISDLNAGIADVKYPESHVINDKGRKSEYSDADYAMLPDLEHSINDVRTSTPSTNKKGSNTTENTHKPSLKKIHHNNETEGFNESLKKGLINNAGSAESSRNEMFRKKQSESRGRGYEKNKHELAYKQQYNAKDNDDSSTETYEENPYASIDELGVDKRKEMPYVVHDLIYATPKKRIEIPNEGSGISKPVNEERESDDKSQMKANMSPPEETYSTVKKATLHRNKPSVDNGNYIEVSTHRDDDNEGRIETRELEKVRDSDKTQIRPVKPRRSSIPPRRKRRMSIESNV